MHMKAVRSSVSRIKICFSNRLLSVMSLAPPVLRNSPTPPFWQLRFPIQPHASTAIAIKVVLVPETKRRMSQLGHLALAEPAGLLLPWRRPTGPSKPTILGISLMYRLAIRTRNLRTEIGEPPCFGFT